MTKVSVYKVARLLMYSHIHAAALSAAATTRSDAKPPHRQVVVWVLDLASNQLYHAIIAVNFPYRYCSLSYTVPDSPSTDLSKIN